MFVLARAATYSTLFVGLLLVFVPGGSWNDPGSFGRPNLVPSSMPALPWEWLVGRSPCGAS